MRPYGLIGAVGVRSSTTPRAGMPYTAADEENTSRRTPVPRIAASSVVTPPTFSRWYQSGRATDSAGDLRAARCTTPVTPYPRSTAPTARRSVTAASMSADSSRYVS